MSRRSGSRLAQVVCPASSCGCVFVNSRISGEASSVRERSCHPHFRATGLPLEKREAFPHGRGFIQGGRSSDPANDRRRTAFRWVWEPVATIPWPELAF